MRMQPLRYKSFESGQLAIDGPSINKRVALFIGRSNEQKNSAPLERLLISLKSEGYTLIWCQSKDELTSKILDLHARGCIELIDKFFDDNFISRYLRKFVKATVLLAYPFRWGFFLSFDPQRSIASKVSQYRKLIHALGDDKEISIIAHSAGGRVASLLDSEGSVKNLICFGYPFRHPECPEEPERTRSLGHQQKPFLIIQGRQDEYGGEEVVNRCKLSKSITIQFIDASHEYKSISPETWAIVNRAIINFLSN